MAEECDYCGNDSLQGFIEVRQPRPSDPREMTCIVVLCVGCGGPGLEVGDLLELGHPLPTVGAKPSVWQEWIEKQDYYLWLG